LFDVDDTLVQGGAHVSHRVLEALCQARKAGCTLAIASGRPLCIVNAKLLKSGSFDYAICSNGARVVSLAQGGDIALRTIPRADALDCLRLLEPFRPAWNAFFGGRAYFEWRGASYMLTGRTGAAARAAGRSGGPSGTFARLASVVHRGARFVKRMVTNPSHRHVLSISRCISRAAEGVEKMGCSIPDPAMCARAEDLLREDGRFEVAAMGSTELEVTMRGVNKGTGAKLLMESLGMGQDDSVAFGDGGNDLPLCGVVGRFVAMGNADEDVKAAATEVCPSVAEDGVAVWIEDMLANGAKER
jgi:hydroxymethylpyrimidine pyrophosphatase-like HAD family hydrolase